MRMTYVSTYLPDSGQTQLVSDPKAVQSALQELENMILVDREEQRKLAEQVKFALELDKFVRDYHPDIVKEFLVTTMSKTRLGVEGA